MTILRATRFVFITAGFGVGAWAGVFCFAGLAGCGTGVGGSVLYNNTIVGNGAVVAAASYPTGFFTSGSDINNSTAGEGSVNPTSTTTAVTFSVTASNSASRPQIQIYQDDAAFTNRYRWTSPLNSSSAYLTVQFLPITTANPLVFSVIDTGVGAANQSYTILVQQ